MYIFSEDTETYIMYAETQTAVVIRVSEPWPEGSGEERELYPIHCT